MFTAFPAWTSVRILEIENAQIFDRMSLHARARSASYSPTEGPGARDLHAELDALFTEHSRSNKVTMRMKTTLTIADIDAALDSGFLSGRTQGLVETEATSSGGVGLRDEPAPRQGMRVPSPRRTSRE